MLRILRVSENPNGSSGSHVADYPAPTFTPEHTIKLGEKAGPITLAHEFGHAMLAEVRGALGALYEWGDWLFPPFGSVTPQRQLEECAAWYIAVRLTPQGFLSRREESTNLANGWFAVACLESYGVPRDVAAAVLSNAERDTTPLSTDLVRWLSQTEELLQIPGAAEFLADSERAKRARFACAVGAEI